MEAFPFDMKVGEFNDAYDSAINCRPIRPPHEIAGSGSSNFFLDRRLGLDPVFGEDHSATPGNVKNFLDAVDANGRRYYLYRLDGKDYVGTFTDPVAKTGFVNVSGSGFTASSCNRMVKGRGPKGAQFNLNLGVQMPYTVLTPTAGTAGSKDFPSIPGYAGGYVKFQHDGSLNLSTGQLITFRDGVLKGATLKIDLVESTQPTQDVYVIGTNSRGSLPYSVGANTGTGAQFDVFSAEGSTLLIGHTTGVTMLVLDGANPARQVPIMTTVKPIVDLAKFNANIYALTEDRLYYSESIVNGDTNFYPLDNLPVDIGVSLFPIGKAMIVFGNSNMVVAPLVSADGDQKIVGYSLRYSGKPYSKYSAVFSDKTIMILQKDKQLMELDIVQNDSVSFDVVAKNIMESNRGFFESLPNEGTVFATAGDSRIHFTLAGSSGSTDYFFDKQIKQWFTNVYAKTVNKFIPEFSGVGTEPIGKDFIYSESGDTDAGIAFEQSVSFSMLGWPSAYFTPWIRTLFGLTDVPIDVTLESEFELGGENDKLSQRLTGFEFDTRLSESETGDELPGLGEEPEEKARFDGTLVSLQTGIMRTGRAVRFKYRSTSRFMIGPSYVFYAKTKNFINEPIGNS